MSKQNDFEEDLLLLLFTNSAAGSHISNFGTGGLLASTTAGDLFVSLHTGDPGEAGTQATTEAAYAGPYARIAVARSAGGWTVTQGAPSQASNTAAVTFLEATGGPETETHVGIGHQLTGAGQLIYSGALDSSLIVNTNVQPEFAALALDITED